MTGSVGQEVQTPVLSSLRPIGKLPVRNCVERRAWLTMGGVAHLDPGDWPVWIFSSSAKIVTFREWGGTDNCS